MTLKPNYTQAFIKTFLRYFLLIAVMTGAVPYFQGKGVRIGDIVPVAALGATMFGIFVTALLTPREIKWDDETFRIRTPFPRSGDFNWRQLEAWTPYGQNTSLRIKFAGNQTFAIAPTGFRLEDWRAFQSILQQRFPDKKTLIWLGMRPFRFGKK